MSRFRAWMVPSYEDRCSKATQMAWASIFWMIAPLAFAATSAVQHAMTDDPSAPVEVEMNYVEE